MNRHPRVPRWARRGDLTSAVGAPGPGGGHGAQGHHGPGPALTSPASAHSGSPQGPQVGGPRGGREEEGALAGLPASSDLSLAWAQPVSGLRPVLEGAHTAQGWGLHSTPIGWAAVPRPASAGPGRARLTEVHPVLPMVPRSEGVLPAHPVSSPQVHPLLLVPGLGSPGQCRGGKGVSAPRGPQPRTHPLVTLGRGRACPSCPRRQAARRGGPGQTPHLSPQEEPGRLVGKSH